MRNKIQHKNLTWIDIEKPQTSDIEYLRDTFKFDPLDLEEINRLTYRPKADDHGSYIFIVLHFPVYDSEKENTRGAELEIFITKDHLITIHPLAMPPLKSAIEGCKKHISIIERYMGNSTGHLLYFIIERLFDSCFPKLDRIAEKINDVEDHIFNGNEKEMVKEISLAQREVLDFRRALKPQRSILESLAMMDSEILPKKLQPYFRDLIGSNIRVWNTLENHKETIEALKDTNESLLSNKISEIIKILTIVSFTTLPLSVVANYFSMSVFNDIAIMNHPAVPALILAGMAVLTLALLTYFKKKKWL